MKICDKCKKKEKGLIGREIHAHIWMGTTKDESIQGDLCQECYFEVFSYIFGEDQLTKMISGRM